MISAGGMDRRVTLWRKEEVRRDMLNMPVFDWYEVRQFWAAKVHKREGESFDDEARMKVASAEVKFQARWSDDIQVNDCLECEGLEYDVLGWREIGRREGIEIACEVAR